MTDKEGHVNAQGNGDTGGHGAAAGHAPSARTYVLVFVTLMVLAGTTYALGEGKLGAASLPVAMVIATVKSALVLLFFMHLWEHKGAARVALAIAVFFMLMLIGGTLSDVATRYPSINPAKAPFGIEPPRALHRSPGGIGGHAE